MTSCTMRTRWLHSPLRTAGISTALFAAEHAIDVAEVNDRLLHKFGISYTGVAASGIIRECPAKRTPVVPGRYLRYLLRSTTLQHD